MADRHSGDRQKERHHHHKNNGSGEINADQHQRRHKEHHSPRNGRSRDNGREKISSDGVYSKNRQDASGVMRSGRGGSSSVDPSMRTPSGVVELVPASAMPPAPTTGLMAGGYGASGFKSGHLEVNSLYSGATGELTVNSMNAPNNSTLQCGCENIDCPFCNQMLSIQLSGSM